jgi:hypothetical protein
MLSGETQQSLPVAMEIPAMAPDKQDGRCQKRQPHEAGECGETGYDVDLENKGDQHHQYKRGTGPGFGQGAASAPEHPQ